MVSVPVVGPISVVPPQKKFYHTTMQKQGVPQSNLARETNCIMGGPTLDLSEGLKVECLTSG